MPLVSTCISALVGTARRPSISISVKLTSRPRSEIEEIPAKEAAEICTSEKVQGPVRIVGAAAGLNAGGWFEYDSMFEPERCSRAPASTVTSKPRRPRASRRPRQSRLSRSRAKPAEPTVAAVQDNAPVPAACQMPEPGPAEPGRRPDGRSSAIQIQLPGGPCFRSRTDLHCPGRRRRRLPAVNAHRHAPTTPGSTKIAAQTNSPSKSAR